MSEWIHNPSVQVAVNDQIKLIFEAPMWKPKSLAGLLPIDPRQVGLTTQGQEEVVEKQFLITLHHKFWSPDRLPLRSFFYLLTRKAAAGVKMSLIRRARPTSRT